MVDLAKEIGVVRDPRASSLSYYCTEDVVGIDERVVEQLLEVSAQSGHCDARICLHTSPDSNFHEMIILQHRGGYYRPHMHRNKGESCHIIRGKVCFFVFNDDGTIVDQRMIGEEESIMYRAGMDRWHTVIPITDLAVYHESKPGPYVRQGDSLYPEWAPDGRDIEEAGRYIEYLMALAKGGS
jgi:cupin fold WbuC family metalloprotein